MDTRLLALLYQMRDALLNNDPDTLGLTLVAAIELSEWSMTIEAQCDKRNLAAQAAYEILITLGFK